MSEALAGHSALSGQPHLSVEYVRSATGGLASVRVDDSLQSAMTEMLLKNFSQLAVLNGNGEVAGALTWRAVAIALSKGLEAVRDSYQPVETVRRNAELLPLIQRIYEYDFVFVTTEAGKGEGIVTTADLTLTFADQARLFLQLGEIDKNLRKALIARFTVDALSTEFKAAGKRLSLSSYDDSTMGTYQQALSLPAVWEAIGWPLDREHMCAAIDTARRVRNHVMHFNEGEPSPEDCATVTNLVETLRRYT